MPKSDRHCASSSCLLDQSVYKTSRRNFLKKSVVGVGGALGASLSAGSPVFSVARFKKPADLPRAKGLRCVVVGGGWSGLTMAKYLKASNPLFEVILVEKNALFNSSIFSNPWLVNAVTTDFTQFSYINAAKNNDYIYMQASMVDINKSKKIVYTDKGSLNYEYLILAPGIEYDYRRMGVEDKSQQLALKQNFPGAYQNHAELLSLKTKIQDYVGGNFVLSVPKGNYRCLAGPYERACLMADYFKREKIDGKIILLDQNPKPRILTKQFLGVFKEHYKDQLDYHPSTKFSNIDVDGKIVDSNHGQIEFEDASFYPPVRASSLLENIGLSKKKAIQKEADIDPLKYYTKKNNHIFVTGDARPQPFSKDAYTAYSEAQYVSKSINAHFNGEDIAWHSPETVTYNMLASKPARGIRFSTRYVALDKGKRWKIEKTTSTAKMSEKISQERMSWGKRLYNDMIEA